MPGFIAWLDTPAGRVPQISCELTLADHLGACKARWGIGRMDFMVPAGLYALGHPTAESPVVVTANYKMTFDLVRRALAGRNLWLLVLETYGINVWCAAGKGTFGTGEVVRRVEASRLAEVVNHRRLILPLLGAPGVSAYQVTRRCGFAVSFAAVDIADLPAYLDGGEITTPAMRELRFTLYDRLVLIPVEVVLELRSLLLIALVPLIVCGLAADLSRGLLAAGAAAGAVLAGTVVAPLLLPWLPSRSFAVKGAVVGLAWAIACRTLAGTDWSGATTAAALLILPAISAFYTLNFTGCTPYTSRSGVKKEMRLALPLMAGSIVLGTILLAVAAWL